MAINRKNENLFAERQVVTGVSDVSCDISAHVWSREKAGYRLTCKKYYAIMPLMRSRKMAAGKKMARKKAI
jgi:hypothetical protein